MSRCRPLWLVVNRTSPTAGWLAPRRRRSAAYPRSTWPSRTTIRPSTSTAHSSSIWSWPWRVPGKVIAGQPEQGEVALVAGVDVIGVHGEEDLFPGVSIHRDVLGGHRFRPRTLLRQGVDELVDRGSGGVGPGGSHVAGLPVHGYSRPSKAKTPRRPADRRRAGGVAPAQDASVRLPVPAGCGDGDGDRHAAVGRPQEDVGARGRPTLGGDGVGSAADCLQGRRWRHGARRSATPGLDGHERASVIDRIDGQVLVSHQEVRRAARGGGNHAEERIDLGRPGGIHQVCAIGRPGDPVRVHASIELCSEPLIGRGIDQRNDLLAWCAVSREVIRPHQDDVVPSRNIDAALVDDRLAIRRPDRADAVDRREERGQVALFFRGQVDHAQFVVEVRPSGRRSARRRATR